MEMLVDTTKLENYHLLPSRMIELVLDVQMELLQRVSETHDLDLAELSGKLAAVRLKSTKAEEGLRKLAVRNTIPAKKAELRLVHSKD